MSPPPSASPTKELPPPDLSQTGLVVVAAGSGTRFGGYKQLIPLIDKPLLVQTLQNFTAMPFARRIVVLPSDLLLQGTWDSLVASHPDLRGFEAVIGREERALSVREGVRALPPECEFVAVHDGARPLPPLGAMYRCLQMIQADRTISAAIVAAPVTDTIKRVQRHGPLIERTENRDTLVRAETPQVCRILHLLTALSDETKGQPRDEAEALELLGHRTAYVLHTGFNPKVTHPTDIAIVTAYLTAHDDTTPGKDEGVLLDRAEFARR